MTNVDKLIHRLGGFGRYQKRLLFLLALPIASEGMFMIMMVFALYTPHHTCKTPQDLTNRSDAFNYTYTVSDCEIKQEGMLNGPGNSSNLSSYNVMPHLMTSSSCQEWDYADDVFTETFTTTHNLVCDDAIKVSHAQMVFYFGVVLGDIFFGLLSDYIGRKNAFMISITLFFVSGLTVAWAPEYYSFVIGQFVVGVACKGNMVLSFVYGLEFVGPSIRVGVGVPFNMYFAFGLCLLCGVGVLIRNWQYIQIVSSVPILFYVLYWFVLDESPRWLISQGRTAEARTVLHNIARVNNVTPPKDLMDLVEIEEKHPDKIWHLFQHKVLTIRTLVVFFNWFAIGMTYYGVFLHAESLGDNFYLTIFLLSVIELPILFISLYLLNRFGRKKVHCIFMCMGGLACICTIFPVIFGGDELRPLILTLAVIGKMGSSGAFGSIYVMSGELFPTVIRTGAVGASSCFARIASMVAPYIAKLGLVVGGEVGNAVPLIIFGSCSILAGLSSLYLPETMGCKLPDTIEEAKHFVRLGEDEQEGNTGEEVPS